MTDNKFEPVTTIIGMAIGSWIGYLGGSSFFEYANSIKDAPDVLTIFYKALPDFTSEALTAVIGASLGGSLGRNIGYLVDGTISDMRRK